MTAYIMLNGKKVQYEIVYKRVKNINLRIRSDGTVTVSANRFVSAARIEAFMQQKAGFILRSLEDFSKKQDGEKKMYFTSAEIVNVILAECEKAYPYFQKRGLMVFPQIKFRKMVSRWGSCNPQKGVLTFNTNLMYAPHPCVEYVVLHEFTHFLQANHSPKFYAELEKVCPDWKIWRQTLKEVRIR